MCGHITIFSEREPVSEAHLREGLRVLHHRGPDAARTWVDASRRLAMGHARLSIIDLAGGDQPLHTSDGRLHAVVNGELYGFETIRDDLEARGHRFLTRSDSEIILHLYREMGTACLESLRGEFAFTLWDPDNNTLFAARDRFGIKPLFYSRTGGRLFVASEVKALFAAGVPRQWDDEAVWHVHQCLTIPDGRTLYKNVYQVPPGHFLLANGGHLRVHPYWDFDYPQLADTVLPTSEANAIEQVRAALHDAVKVRLRADVPVGCYLSGGLDSCTVLGIAQQYLPKPMRAFTIAFTDDATAGDYNEEAIARATAAHCGAEYTPLSVTTQDMADKFADAVGSAEYIFVNGHAVAKYLLSKAVRDAGCKVVLTGEGADEIFAGYASFRKDFLLSRSASQADAQGALEKLRAGNAPSANILLAREDLQIPTLNSVLGFTPSFMEPFAALAPTLSGVLAPRIKERHGARDTFRLWLNNVDVARQLHGRDRVHQAMYLWSKSQLNNYLLTCLGDRMEMAHSVEGRTPMLDHRLVEMVVRMPAELKIKGTTEKYLLREAAKPVLTDAVYRRQKHPFIAPPAATAPSGPLQQLIQDTLRGQALAAVPFYNAAQVRGLLDSLPHLDPVRRGHLEPALLTILSMTLLHQRMNMGDALA